MPNRFFTDFSGNGTTFIGIPSYTGAITYKCFPRVNNTGLPNSPTVVLNQWNTFTTSVTALTEIGRSFNGIIAGISGSGLNIPVALSTGIEAPAALNGVGFTQYECEELNYGDWVRVENKFTAGTAIIESGTVVGFPAGLTLNNLTANRQYYVDVLFEVIDGSGNVLNEVIPYGRYNYKLGSLTTQQHDNGRYSIGSAYYPITTASNSHYIQVVGATTTQRVRVTSRVSEVMKQPRVATNYLYVLGNGQSLSVGTSGGALTDDAHIAPVRDNKTHWMAGNSRPTARGQGITTSYQHMRPWTESRAQQTHVHAMLSQLDGATPANWNTWTINEGVSGQSIDAMTGYASAHAGVALSQFTATTLPVATERAAAVIVHGEANSVDFATYATKLGVLHDNYIAEVLVRRPSIAGTDMILDQTGGNAAYWNVALKTWEYSVLRADAFLAGPKYHINYRFPAIPVTDTVHLNAHGYDIQGEYIAKALRNAAWGDRQWKPFQPKLAYPSAGNTFTVEFDVPVLPIVQDTTIVPAAAGNGVTYVSGGSNLTPSAFAINGNKIVFTISQPAAVGEKVQFGNNNVSTFNITNFRDSDTEIGEVSGEVLHNWLVLSEMTLTTPPVTIPPEPSLPPGYTRYLTNITTASQSSGSIFQGITVENDMPVHLPNSVTPTGSGGYIDGFLIADPGVVEYYIYTPSNGDYDAYTVELIAPPSGVAEPRTVPRLRVSGGQILTSMEVSLVLGAPVYIDPNGQFVNTPNGQPFLSGCTISGGNIVFGRTTITPPAVIYRAPDGGVTATPNGDPIAEFIA